MALRSLCPRLSSMPLIPRDPLSIVPTDELTPVELEHGGGAKVDA